MSPRKDRFDQRGVWVSTVPKVGDDSVDGEGHDTVLDGRSVVVVVDREPPCAAAPPGRPPTILGRGKRLFPDGIDRRKLRLVEARTVGPDGVQVHTYRRA
jgi:hypothetical protein